MQINIKLFEDRINIKDVNNQISETIMATNKEIV